MQYECLKTELKEEYEKKINYLKERLKKRAIKDPSFLLFTQLINEGDKKKNIKEDGKTKKKNDDNSNNYMLPGNCDNIRLTDKERLYEFYLQSA